MAEEKYPPFVRSVAFAPTEIPQQPTLANSLQLEFVYGAGRKACKGNILYTNKNNKLVYPAAATCVVYNEVDHSQRIFNMHKDDVACIAMHPDQVTFASGEIGRDDCVYIWDSETLEVRQKLSTGVQFKNGGVIAVSFSDDGKLLAAVGGNPLDSVLVVFEWESGTIVAQGKGLNAYVYDLSFTKNNDILMLGKNAIKFEVIQGNAIDEQNAICHPKGEQQTSYCSCRDDKGRQVVGTQSGNIYFFKEHQLNSVKQAHTGSVFTLEKIENGFLSGGKDGMLCVWKIGENNKITKTNSFNLGSSIRSVCQSKVDPNVAYAVTDAGDFLKITLNGDNHTTKFLMRGHGVTKGELWGLGIARSSKFFVSGGDDGRVIIWNRDSRKAVACVNVQSKVRGIAVSPDCLHVAASTIDGFVKIFGFQALINGKDTPITALQCGPEEIAAIQYSPCGKILAVGSHNNKIYLYQSRKSYAAAGVLEGHNSFVTALDFSADSKFIRSIDGAYETLFWNVDTKEMVRYHAPFSNVKFATSTCKLGWHVRGIWNPERYADGTDINSVDVNYSKNVIAFGDDKGCVNIAAYPTVSTTVETKSFYAHCEHVTSARFSSEGNFLYTTGGADQCVMQWRVV